MDANNDVEATIRVTENERTYMGPPPGWVGMRPSSESHDLCITNLPTNVLEDRLLPAFQAFGSLYELRLVMNSSDAQRNLGIAFVTYAVAEDCTNALIHFRATPLVLDGNEISISPNRKHHRLYIKPIPRDFCKDELMRVVSNTLVGVHVKEITVLPDSEDPLSIRPYVFVDFEDRESAVIARKLIASGMLIIAGQTCVGDFPDEEYEPDPEVMRNVKNLFVRCAAFTTEIALRNTFSPYGDVSKVKKMKDFAFVNFVKREDALAAIQGCHGMMLDNFKLEVNLAKPLSMERKQAVSAFKLHQGGTGANNTGLNVSATPSGAVVIPGRHAMAQTGHRTAPLQMTGSTTSVGGTYLSAGGPRIPPGADPNRYKQVICEFFNKGSCRQGMKCTYAHGIAEQEYFQDLAQRVLKYPIPPATPILDYEVWKRRHNANYEHRSSRDDDHGRSSRDDDRRRDDRRRDDDRRRRRSRSRSRSRSRTRGERSRGSDRNRRRSRDRSSSRRNEDRSRHESSSNNNKEKAYDFSPAGWEGWDYSSKEYADYYAAYLKFAKEHPEQVIEFSSGNRGGDNGVVATTAAVDVAAYAAAGMDGFDYSGGF